jgi:SAM-dependent methyltransferase
VSEDLYAGYTHSRFVPDARRRVVWEVIADYLGEFLDPQGAVLDLGSGYCEFINAVRARKRYALDRFVDPAEHAAPGVVALQSDAADLSGVDEPLSAVFSSNLLEHLSQEDAVAVAKAVYAQLAPGGRFILLQPNFRYCAKTYFDDYTHRTIYTHVSLPDFLRAQGFRIERVEPRFLPFSMHTRAPMWRPLVWAYLRAPWRPLAKQMLVVAQR